MKLLIIAPKKFLFCNVISGSQAPRRSCYEDFEGSMRGNFFSKISNISNFFEKKLLNLVHNSPEQKFLEIQLDITNHCNLKCSHCYHSHHRNDGALGLQEWIKILEQYDVLLKKLQRLPFVILCGGEPTTCPYLLPLLSHIRLMFGDCPVVLLTNGTTLRPTLVERLKPWNLRFQVSLDGHDAQSHDSVRGQGNFKRALKGVQELRDAGQKVSVLAILSRRTAPHLQDFFAMARQNNIEELNFVRFVAEGDGLKLVSTNADGPLLGVELKQAYQEIFTLSQKFGVRTNTAKPLYAALNVAGSRLGAHYRYQAIVVDYRGRLKVSSRAPVTLGNVLEVGLEELYLKNPILKALRESKIEGCGSCKLLARCGGDRNAAFVATGSFLAPDPGCWLINCSQ